MHPGVRLSLIVLVAVLAWIATAWLLGDRYADVAFLVTLVVLTLASVTG